MEAVLMQFLLFDVSATLVFLAGYLTVVTLQRPRALPVPASKPAPSGEPRNCQNCVKWPRLSAPR
jgi:hypothetical protein